MEKIAVLLTCFNRKDKTVRALKSLSTAFEKAPSLEYHIFLTDDGSTDGTADAVRAEYPNLTIIQGDGNLFWANGMRSSWKKAREKDYDAYFLINDDTAFYPHCLEELLRAHEFSMNTYSKGGIYIGCTEDEEKGIPTYSGSTIANKWLYKLRRLTPNGKFQQVDLGNANIMLVPAEVVDKIGILSPGFAHGKADYDYTYRARKKNIPVLISSRFCGHCTYDHVDYYEGFEKLSRTDRKKVVYNPTKLDSHSHLTFMQRHFPLRAVFVRFFIFLKIYFPSLYLRFFKR